MTTNINHLIYEIRGQQVMLDSDLAMLYECANGTKTINQAIKRNKSRFPEDFYFQLTKEEVNDLANTNYSRFQSETLNEETNNRSQIGTGSEKLWYQSGTANDDTLENKGELRFQSGTLNEKIDNRFQSETGSEDLKFQIGTSSLSKHRDPKYLPYAFTEQGVAMLSSVLRTERAAKVSVDIMRAFVAMRKIIIIDNYLDKTILDVLKYKSKSVKVTLVTNEVKTKLDINKFKSQYQELKLITNSNFHDCYIIVDNKVLYHLGASLKDLSKGIFSINQITDPVYLSRLSNYIS